MASATIQVTGLDEFINKFTQLAKPEEVFDDVLDATAENSKKNLMENTPRGFTGKTRDAWEKEKVSPGTYQVINATKTNSKGGRYKEYSIPWLINDGRGKVLPIPPNNRLFIPLTAEAAETGYQPGMKFGVDFVYAKESKAVDGTHFVDKEISRSSSDLQVRVSTRVREIFEGSVQIGNVR